MKQYSIITNAILNTATERGAHKSTCPSEIARMLFPNNWRSYMKEIVAIAIELQQQGKIMITQKGEQVDLANIKGPIRIKIK